ncbi:GTP-binding protein [Alkalithermobacter thermoalcaliphilus JW-YL-7 = DSM 7308]|uniref:GTPase Obg n=1 Tax=Alkalithermobacter thermoalcaliphilus JW-YL-7 = DSM 7308 TaxID=1121328 RepID=A0A150FR97_CLOPD|nr:GTPase obg [[Clostridium] paradoxum JW-YL-7 = DSM 7308]SHL03018.1 GTP-binding protein [[Clostridium] paradoxum JW-YL-7 = DSM 7308]
MFIDKARIFVKGGKGGNGAVAFRREKYVPAGGPDGGDGGRGGSVIFEVDEGLRTLMDFKYKTKYVASSGEDGKSKSKHGKSGEDLVLKVPPGTIIRDEETNLVIADLKNHKDKAVVARGGKGGRGNNHFTTSVRQAPTFAEAGREGEERWIILELKLIADVGLLGFPNVGKSTFLSIVTSAKPKIANYHFTTLTPNLGVVQTKYGDSFVLADIPGLIEGASEGVGLGHDFLRHVERTKVLIHIVDISGMEGRDPIDDFEKINDELKKYNQKLASRPQVVVANKIDLLDSKDDYEIFKQEIESRGYKVFAMSAATREGVDDVINYVANLLKEVEDIQIISEEEMMKEDLKENVVEEITVRLEDGVYIVEGKELQRLLYSINFEDMESLQYFQKIMEKKGIFDKLRQLGVQDGDLVKIYDLEFEYYE